LSRFEFIAAEVSRNSQKPVIESDDRSVLFLQPQLNSGRIKSKIEQLMEKRIIIFFCPDNDCRKSVARVSKFGLSGNSKDVVSASLDAAESES
jgi:hypothetical protein